MWSKSFSAATSLWYGYTFMAERSGERNPSFSHGCVPSYVHVPVRRHDKRPGGPKHSLPGGEVNVLAPAQDTSSDPFLFVHGGHK